jgi:hypothetical protein
MNVNNVADVVIELTINYFNRLDLLLFTKVNKKFNRYKSKQNAHYEIVINNKYKTTQIFAIAAYEGYLDVCQYLKENIFIDNINSRNTWSWITCLAAACNNHLDVLIWLCNNGCEIHAQTCFDCVVDKGHLEILKWLYSKYNNILTNDRVCECAAFNGYLNVIKWARENNFPWDESTCDSAVMGGHLDCFIWVVENGCLFDRSIMHRAARNGHLNILEWMCDIGNFELLLDENIYLMASGRGFLNVMIWAKQQHGCSLSDSKLNDCMQEAKRCNQMHVFEWLKNNFNKN